MQKEEYLKLVTEQIRCREAREPVREELEQHILDQAEEFCKEGLTEDEAIERAVEEMGDPVETGVSMDWIHRPQMAWGMLVLIGIISLLSLVIQTMLGIFTEGQLGGWAAFDNHALNMGAGFLLMLVVYRLDYSFIARHTMPAAVGFLTIAAAAILFGGTLINGSTYYIVWRGPSIAVSALLLLYIPIYAGILYYYKGDGYKILGKAFAWAVLPLFFAMRIPSISTAFILLLSFAGMFSAAALKGWYRIRGKRTTALLWLLILALPVCLPGLGLAGGMLAPYQMDRLSVLTGGDYGYTFTASIIQKIISSCYLIGRSQEGLNLAAESLAGYNSDHVIVSIMAVYGILAGVAVILLLMVLIVKIFHISIKQKNQLGMVMGCGCGIAFLMQALLNILVNFSEVPETSIVLPLFSLGGSNMIVSYILLGLVLSIYRYKHILRGNLRTDKLTGRKLRRICR